MPLTAKPRTKAHRLAMRSMRSQFLVVFVLVCLFFAVALLALIIGARGLSLSEIWQAMINPLANDTATIVIYQLRLPRLYVGVFVGACLAISGLLVQNVTHNFIAEPGILGINAGASLFAVIGIWAFGVTHPLALAWFALLGAGVATAFVMMLGFAGSGRTSSMRLILIGSAVSAIFLTLTASILFISDETINVFRHWVVGSLAGGSNARAVQLTMLLPFFALGIILALIACRGLNIILLGEESARALGVHIGRVRLLAILAIVLLSATATAVAGPIVFLGLVVPHIARQMIGASLWWQFAACLLIGPIILLSGDVLGRVVLNSGEVPAGVIMVFVGAPIFLMMIRKSKVLSI